MQVGAVQDEQIQNFFKSSLASNIFLVRKGTFAPYWSWLHPLEILSLRWTLAFTSGV